MRENLSPQSKQVLENPRTLRQTFAQVLPPDLLDYVMMLIVKDSAHHKFLKLMQDEEVESNEAC